jgi:hypothetical protein
VYVDGEMLWSPLTMFTITSREGLAKRKGLSVDEAYQVHAQYEQNVRRLNDDSRRLTSPIGGSLNSGKSMTLTMLS